MKKLWTKNIPSQPFTVKLAEFLVNDYLKDADKFTIFLEGGLGAGKTFLAQEILRNLGVEDLHGSPTYTLVNEYTVNEKNYAHFDFYRLEEPHDFFARGFQDIAEEPSTSSLIEWPDKISPEAKMAFGGNVFTLKIDFGIGVGMRKVSLLQG